MKQRTLGKGGLAVSEVGFGCMGLSEFYGPADDAQSLRVMERAFELGVTFFDSADMYGRGHNEELVSRFLAGRNGAVAIATKFGIVRDPDGGYARHLDNSPAYVRQACEASLRRLKVERIDLYYVHRVDRNTPIEETIGALAGLVREGKVGHIGLCEVSAATLRRAHAVHPIAAVQSEYSLWTRDPEAEVLPACRELGVGLVAYSPLGRGFLTGRIDTTNGLSGDDFRRFNPRFADGNLEHNLSLLDAVGAIAASRDVTLGQVALAWLLARGGDVVPIPGTKRISYLEENVGAAEVRLTEDEIRRLDAALPPGAAQGERYSEEGMKGLDA